MIIDIDLTVGDLVGQIESLGGFVKWQRSVPDVDRPVRFDDVTVDDYYVAGELHPSWFEADEELADGDPRDIRDFVAACLAGDRATAEALLPRLFGSAAGQAAAEQVLRPVRRAA